MFVLNTFKFGFNKAIVKCAMNYIPRWLKLGCAIFPNAFNPSNYSF